MRSSFILASLFSLAIAAPLASSPDNQDVCAYEPRVCIQSVEGQCECERKNVEEINAELRAKGCTDLVEVSDNCGIMSILPVTEPLPAGTVTATTSQEDEAEGRVCGGFVGVECPDGLTCVIPEEEDGAVVNDAQGICKVEPITTV